MRVYDSEHCSLLREVNTQMSCCAAVAALSTRAAAATGHFCLRVTCGGCNSGAIKLAYLDVKALKSRQLQFSPQGRVCDMLCRNQECGHEDCERC